MQTASAGPEDGPDVVVVMGWGNKLHHENVQWLRDLLTDAGYRAHMFQIPEVISDFETEYLAPVQTYTAALDEFRLVSHSTGGLITAYLDGGFTRTYLSPWWGFPSGPVGLDSAVLSLFTSIPISRPIIPTGEASREDLGELATETQLSEGPSRAAPTFLREARRAQAARPAIDDDAVVFCSPRDSVVGIRPVVRAVDFDQLVFYDGGHEWFSSTEREAHVDTFLDAVEDGLDGLDTA